jgi:hypothetical protein
MSKEKADGFILVMILCFLSSIVTAIVVGFNVEASDSYIDNEKVKKDRNDCVLRRYQYAREYVDTCAPAFRSVDD